jgi:hypothetical protein
MIAEKDLFPDTSITQLEVDIIVNCELPMLSSRDVRRFMQLPIQLSKCHRNIEILPRYLPSIVECLKISPIVGANAKDITNLIYSLQAVRENDTGAKDFLTLMTKMVTKSMIDESLNDSEDQTFSSQGVSMILFGLRSMSSNSIEVCELLNALIPKVQSCREELNAQAVGNALYGLHGMSSHHPEVRAIISALAFKVQSCRELDAQAVGNALNGLKENEQ